MSISDRDWRGGQRQGLACLEQNSLLVAAGWTDLVGPEHQVVDAFAPVALDHVWVEALNSDIATKRVG